jgi:serine protease AprX
MFAADAGIFVATSAGNNGPTASTITSPGIDPWVITVGAVDDAGTVLTTDDAVATFSSRGPTPIDAIAKPDLVAPGRKMVSLRSPGSELDTLYPDRRVSTSPLADARYFVLSGTSMAAPVVAGAAALLLQREPTLTPAQVKRRLLSTADPVAPNDRNVSGAGMLDVVRALTSTDRTAATTSRRVTDAFARNAYGVLYGTPLVWRDPTYGGVNWSAVTWATIDWSAITWENFSWDAVTWESITWEEITWEEITWESLSSLSAGALSGTGDAGWVVMD